MFFLKSRRMFSNNVLILNSEQKLGTWDKLTHLKVFQNGAQIILSACNIPLRFHDLDPDVLKTFEFSFQKSREENMTEEEDDEVTAGFIRPTSPSSLVSFRSRKSSRRDASVRLHSLLPMSRPDVKYGEVVGVIIPVETTVSFFILKGE